MMNDARMTVSEFIDALGGTGATAKIFEVGPSAVSNWRAAGRLPPRLHLRAAKLAAKRRIKFDPETATEGKK